MIPAFLVIGAARYALGRRSHVVGETCRLLMANWADLPEEARTVIARDVDEAISSDDNMRAQGSDYRPLGDDCAREEWLWLRANTWGK